MIKPTIGRIVLFRPNDPDYDETKRYAAIVANVNDDGTVHLGVFNHYGVNESEQSVTLVQDDEVPERGQCEWMPYQKGQAAKYDVTTDDLMARIARLEELLTSDQVGLELPPLALKTPAEEIPDNVTDITKGDDVDTTAKQDIEQGMASGDVTESPDGADESADAAASADDGASAEATEEGKVDEDVTESAALMGLKTHAAEVELANVGFLDNEGEPCAEGIQIHEVVYTFIDRVEYSVSFDEHESLAEFKFKTVPAAEATAES